MPKIEISDYNLRSVNIKKNLSLYRHIFFFFLTLYVLHQLIYQFIEIYVLLMNVDKYVICKSLPAVKYLHQNDVV